TPVEIVGCEVCEAGSPLALDDGWFTDQRNALERVLLHFAHFEKRAKKIDDERYSVMVNYDKEDETKIDRSKKLRAMMVRNFFFVNQYV
ncbi:MAG: hypothetical protein K2O96_01850, partial [Lachnospiraceae bacterium]|nr:hypothetical protein [Lachnospiraceae bacterium]